MINLINKKAPDFDAPAVWEDGDLVGSLRLKYHIENSYAVLFFYPFDFTVVCPTELIELDNRIEDFRERNTKIIGISMDSAYTHAAWRRIRTEDGGIGSVRYPIVSDLGGRIAKEYGVLSPEETCSLRGTIIIDTNSIVRSIMINDLPIGRNIEEIIRLIDAIDYNQKYGELCPVNWAKGKESLPPLYIRETPGEWYE